MNTNWWLYGRTLIIEPMVKGKQVLDVGCGSGFLSIRLAQRGFELTCLDISKKALAAIKNLQGIERTRSRMDLILGDAQWLPLRNDLYDSVICTDVLEHLAKDEKALEEIFRVSKLEGISIISVPTLNDGLVFPCCTVIVPIPNREEQAKLSFGNAFEDEFQNIWRSRKYEDLRRRIKNGISPSICAGCPLFG